MTSGHVWYRDIVINGNLMYGKPQGKIRTSASVRRGTLWNALLEVADFLVSSRPFLADVVR